MFEKPRLIVNTHSVCCRAAADQNGVREQPDAEDVPLSVCELLLVMLLHCFLQREGGGISGGACLLAGHLPQWGGETFLCDQTFAWIDMQLYFLNEMCNIVYSVIPAAAWLNWPHSYQSSWQERPSGITYRKSFCREFHTQTSNWFKSFILLFSL